MGLCWSSRTATDLLVLLSNLPFVIRSIITVIFKKEGTRFRQLRSRPSSFHFSRAEVRRVRKRVKLNRRGGVEINDVRRS